LFAKAQAVFVFFAQIIEKNQPICDDNAKALFDRTVKLAARPAVDSHAACRQCPSGISMPVSPAC